MKLLRLTTENVNCVFDTVFNEDVIVKPFSKVCLQAFTTQLNKGELEINNQNNEIQFTLDGANPGEENWFIVNLTNGLYTSSNINVLLKDIRDRLNEAMNGATPATLGNQWGAVINGNRIVIECERGEVLTFNDTTIVSKYLRFVKSTLEPLPGESYCSRTSGTNQTGDSYFLSLQPTNKGASSLRCQLRSNPTPDNTGFVLGYMGNSAAKPNILTTDLVYGIRFVDDAVTGLRYEVVYNGVVLPSDQMANNPVPVIVGPANPDNDVLQIDITNNSDVKFSIFKPATSQYITLYQPPDFVDADNLFAIGVFLGSTQVFQFQNTTDPYYIVPEKYIRYKSSPKTPKYTVPIPTGPYVSKTNFSFSSSELATSLGYEQSVFPPQVTFGMITYKEQANVSLLANYPFFLKLNSDSYIVELLDTKLNSMDGMSNQRRNILAVIPQESTIVERVTFNASVLIFIDLNNKEPINLRHIRARVLTVGLEPIFVYGLSQLVLLID
jgi:hypothetical protein